MVPSFAILIHLQLPGYIPRLKSRFCARRPTPVPRG
nr:MAG TPA: hypothetical protein [Caudoviricetes sp.]